MKPVVAVIFGLCAETALPRPLGIVSTGHHEATHGGPHPPRVERHPALVLEARPSTNEAWARRSAQRDDPGGVGKLADDAPAGRGSRRLDEGRKSVD